MTGSSNILFMSTRHGEPVAAPSEPAVTYNGRTDVALALTWAALIVGPPWPIGYVFRRVGHAARYLMQVLFRVASLRTGRTRFRVPGSPVTTT